MQKKTHEFLKLYSILENYLQKITDASNKTSAGKLLDLACEKNSYLNHHRQLLEDLIQLRHVLVHEYDQKVIAVPTDETLELLREITDRIEHPVTLDQIFHSKKVIKVKSTDSVYECLKIMTTRKFKQIPVYDGKEYRGVITGHVISSWLGEKYLDNSKTSIKQLFKSQSVNNLLEYEKVKDRVYFLARNCTVYDFIDEHVHNPSPSGVYLITETGSANQMPMSIITPEDHDEIYRHTHLFEHK
jgi:predicted transcriptional regulator